MGFGIHFNGSSELHAFFFLFLYATHIQQFLKALLSPGPQQLSDRSHQTIQ